MSNKQSYKRRASLRTTLMLRETVMHPASGTTAQRKAAASACNDNINKAARRKKFRGRPPKGGKVMEVKP